MNHSMIRKCSVFLYHHQCTITRSCSLSLYPSTRLRYSPRDVVVEGAQRRVGHIHWQRAVGVEQEEVDTHIPHISDIRITYCYGLLKSQGTVSVSISIGTFEICILFPYQSIQRFKIMSLLYSQLL
jgi:hypothetical protein